MSALAGLESLMGYEGEEPVGMLGYSFGDVNGGAHAIFVALSALRHARETGRGQFIDFSLTETQMAVLNEPMAEIALTGVEPSTQGMRHRRLAPHGHYPCAGDDQWIALSVHDAHEWRKLAALVGPAALQAEADSDRPQMRLARRNAIDAAIASWTRTRSRDDALHELQNKGLAATPVLSSDELARSWPADNYVELPHPVTGADRVLTVPWRMSLTPPRPPRAAPLVGQHTRYVLEQILGIDVAETDALLALPATA
jgi:benzylsuccinate CoA-transferase BbsF subunit